MATNRTATRKGECVERELVELHRDLGIKAQWVPRSGAAGGDFAGDLHLHLFGADIEPLVGEVKARASTATESTWRLGWRGWPNQAAFAFPQVSTTRCAIGSNCRSKTWASRSSRTFLILPFQQAE